MAMDKNTDDARQGVTGQGVRWVLYIGTALAAIVLFGYLIGWL
jgi:hypothetical protein